MTVTETHLLEWATEKCADEDLPDTHANRCAFAAWALATSREHVETYLAAGPVDDAAREDRARLRQALAVGADAHLIARLIGPHGGEHLAVYINHVLDGDFSIFDPAAVEVDPVLVAERAAVADLELPATRGDITALTAAITDLVATLHAQRRPAPAAPAAKRTPAKKTAAAKKAPAVKSTAGTS